MPNPNAGRGCCSACNECTALYDGIDSRHVTWLSASGSASRLLSLSGAGWYCKYGMCILALYARARHANVVAGVRSVAFMLARTFALAWDSVARRTHSTPNVSLGLGP